MRTQARHRILPKPPGPVTGALRVLRKPEPRLLMVLLRIWPAIPPLALIAPLLRHEPLGGYAGTILGLDATLCLVGCVTVTPLLSVVRVKATRYRMIYGVWMFVIGALGLLITLLLDPMVHAVAGNSVQWTGTALILLLLPMTLTSNQVAQRLLGPEWKRWQRTLLWVVYILVLAHLAALRSWDVLAGFGAATIPVIILRIPKVRRSVQRWRKERRYEGWGWWITLHVLAAVYLSGLVTLFTLTGIACASAVH